MERDQLTSLIRTKLSPDLWYHWCLLHLRIWSAKRSNKGSQALLLAYYVWIQSVSNLSACNLSQWKLSSLLYIWQHLSICRALQSCVARLRTGTGLYIACCAIKQSRWLSKLCHNMLQASTMMSNLPVEIQISKQSSAIGPIKWLLSLLKFTTNVSPAEYTWCGFPCHKAVYRANSTLKLLQAIMSQDRSTCTVQCTCRSWP